MYKNQGSMAVRCSSSGRAIGAAIQQPGVYGCLLGQSVGDDWTDRVGRTWVL